VPCPGGSGGGAAGWVVASSPGLLSVLDGGGGGLLVATGMTGGIGVAFETLETLIAKFLWLRQA
jgi:hypothetical protein